MLYIYILIWLLIFIISFYMFRSSKYRGIGLPLIYLSNFAITHFLSPLTFLSPNYYIPSLEISMLGFKYSTIAVICFFLGSSIFILVLNKRPIVNKSINVFNFIKNSKKMRSTSIFYFVIGCCTFFLLNNLFHGLPTVTVFISTGGHLMIVGLCLLIYLGFVKKENNKSYLLLLLSFTIPLITIVKDGYIGTGLSMLIIVLIFSANFLRINIKNSLLFILILYVGLSLYLSYMRDRIEIRYSVWGGSAITNRIETLYTTLKDVEWFSPSNENHLDTINKRMDQNYIVGVSVLYLEHGNIDFARGDTFKNALLNLIPRIIWKDKPISAGDTKRVEKYTGLEFQENTSVGMPQVMEMYINFGIKSLITFFFFFGIFYSYLDYKSRSCLNESNVTKFAIYFFPGLAFLRSEGPIIDGLSTAIASVMIAILIYNLPNKLYPTIIFLIFGFLTLFLVISILFQ